MDIDNFEWWYSEGEAPDEEWDEPAPRDVSIDEDETGNDVAADSDAALGPVDPLTFEQAWARPRQTRPKPMLRPRSASQPTCRSRRQRPAAAPHHRPDSTASFSILDVPSQGAQRSRPHVAPICLTRKIRDVARRSAHPYRLYGRRYRMLGNW